MKLVFVGPLKVFSVWIIVLTSFCAEIGDFSFLKKAYASLTETAPQKTIQKPPQSSFPLKANKKPTKFDPSHYSPAVIAAIITELQEHRDVANASKASEELQIQQLKVLNQRIAFLEQTFLLLKERLEPYNKKQRTEIQKIVKIFENMRSKNAAQIIEELPDDVQAFIFSAMKEIKTAPILSSMHPKNASRAAEILARTSGEGHRPLVDPSQILEKVKNLLPVKQKS
ncbi:MAG: hypothetical protein LBH38_01905 [Holosporales bacterium]|jgi:flagellar motility protein MotE (MotC chaperone)|nr:hypothetical protein [Holosporales bacterium]